MKKKFSPYWLYFHHANLDSIFAAISTAKLPQRFEIKMCMLISSDDLFTELKSWTPKTFTSKVAEEHPNILTIKLVKTITYKEKERQVEGHFNLVRIGNSSVYVAISYDSLGFVKKAMLPYFSHYYTNVSRLYITSNDVKKILDGLKEKTKGEIHTDRVVSNGRITKNGEMVKKGDFWEKIPQISSFRKRTKESDLRWTDEDYATSFRKAAENDQWIDKITFSVRKDQTELFFGFLSRDGLFKCDKNFKLFFETILENASKIGTEKVRLFKKRSRLDNKGMIKPLAIEFSQNIFKDVEHNQRLVRVLAEFPKSSHTVYQENPYLHLALVDYYDGSSYDIWVLSENRIIIVPQLKASFSSISRLSEHIFRRFREGEIKELMVNV